MRDQQASLQQQTAKTVARNLSVSIAESEREILDAQRLRYRVFGQEMGAKLPTRIPGVDQDIYDAYCDHLVCRDENTGEVIGTYRILSPANARRIGSYYTENEFDLTRLQHLRPQLVEIGRSCVHPDYRSGATITLLWAGLARYMLENAGARVTCAGNGRQALEGLENSAPHQYDCVLMDIMMPVMNGLEAAEAIRKLNRKDLQEIPIIAMSANAYSQDVEKAKQAGMNGYLIKPIETRKMIRLLSAYHHSSEQEA